MAIHSSILPWGNLMDTGQRRLARHSPWSCKSQTRLSVPHNAVGKESACNAGDPGSIPGSGRSTGEGISYPLQYFWVSLVAQLVKNLPAMQETQV